MSGAGRPSEGRQCPVTLQQADVGDTIEYTPGFLGDETGYLNDAASAIKWGLYGRLRPVLDAQSNG